MMNAPALLSAYLGLFVAGIVMSLHCVAMCGPILVGFSHIFTRAELTVEGRSPRQRLPLAWDFAFYHLGRIWTYALLGMIAGSFGATLRTVGVQVAGAIIAGIVIVAGVALMGVVPGLNLERLLDGCAMRRMRGWRWFASLLHARGPAARLLLGAVMGLLPCGLVYAMLAAVAAMPSPLHAALGMIAFGLGTVPSLTAVLLASRTVHTRLAAHSTRLAAVALICTGLFMLGRSLIVHDHDHHQDTPAAAHEHHAM